MSNILVIENEPDLLEAVEKILKGVGHQVLTAGSAREAYRLLETMHPDLIMSDIMMPDLDGLKLLRQIRSNQALATTQVIMVSAVADHATIREAMVLGADDFLIKPAGKEEILQAVSGRLRRVRDGLQDFQSRIRRYQDFLAMIAHDFRGPLTAMRLGLYAMENPVPDMEEQPSELIGRAADTMHTMVERLILMSQHQSDGIPLKTEKVNVMELCQRAVDMVAHHRTPRHTLEITGHLDEEVLLDPFLITRSISKVLSNALKYSPDGGRVLLQVAKVHKLIRFAVADEGTGLAAEEVAALFTPHYRASRHDSIPGNGVGLSCVKAFVERHGGTIRCESRLGKGSRFIIEVPLWKPLSSVSRSVDLQVMMTAEARDPDPGEALAVG